MDEAEKSEFEQFEVVQDKLVRALAQGYSHLDAQNVGFYVAQAIRDVPMLLGLLDDFDNHSNDEILNAIHAVVANHFALSEANRLLLGASNDHNP